MRYVHGNRTILGVPIFMCTKPAENRVPKMASLGPFSIGRSSAYRGVLLPLARSHLQCQPTFRPARSKTLRQAKDKIELDLEIRSPRTVVTLLVIQEWYILIVPCRLILLHMTLVLYSAHRAPCGIGSTI
jgi:hypothetical protein